MQYDNKDYNPEIHDRYKALTVKQPYADLLTKPVYRDDAGEYHAAKTIEVRTRTTSHRGDIMVCSSANPVLPGRDSGVTLGLVELYDVKPIAEFTPDDWAATCIPVEERAKITKGFGWLMRNPRPVVEMPIKGQLGVYNLVVPKGDITEYPRALALGKDGYKTLIKKSNERQ